MLFTQKSFLSMEIVLEDRYKKLFSLVKYMKFHNQQFKISLSIKFEKLKNCVRKTKNTKFNIYLGLTNSN